MVTLEAAASGTPSVVSDLPGVRTLVLDGQTGLRATPRDPVSLANALRTFVTNPTIAERMGEFARRRAELEYAWPPLVERLVDIYRGLAK